MAAYHEFSDDVPKYLAETARELAESCRRTEEKLDRMSAIVAAARQDAGRAREALHAAASGLSDFNEASYEATNRATASLIEYGEQCKGEMRRLAELSDMRAAYLSTSRDEGPAPEDEEPD